MKILVIGLGSMGKRRVRCLKALDIQAQDIYGFDPREDRRKETEKLHGIKTFQDFQEAVENGAPTLYIISVPPDVHHDYMKDAVERGIPFFVEASVVDTGLKDIIDETKKKSIVACPSSTLHFHPAIKRISEIIRSGVLGKLSSVHYHSGQYLPDWHTYEHVSEYYVSNPATGGGREIVPFELTWMVNAFGFPKRVAGMYRKTIDIDGAESIDDTYSAILDYEDHLITMTVDVVSRCATRRLLINGSEGQLRWDWDENGIHLYDAEKATWVKEEYEMLAAEDGYNANIGENMYIDEIRAFLEAATQGTPFVNSLERDHMVLKTLYAIEKSDRESQIIPVDYA